MVVVVYSCLTDFRDEPAQVGDFKTPHYMFTNKPELRPALEKAGWIYRSLSRIESFRKRLIYRKVKHMPDEFLSAAASVWIDASIQPLVDLSVLVDQLRGHIAAFPHPLVNATAGEVRLIEERRLPEAARCAQQYKAYKAIGYPDAPPHFETGVLVRRHSPQIRLFGKSVWSEILGWTSRDQVTFGYCLWQHKLTCETLTPGTIHIGPKNPYLILRPHKE